MDQLTKTAKQITIRIPRGKKLGLSPRARFVWARLVRLPFAVSATKLAGWCGGLVGRSDGLAVALDTLVELKLAERGPRGWVALAPSGEMAEKFEWPKRLAHLSRWQDRYGYTPVTVPLTNPFKDWKTTKLVKGKTKKIVTYENALEVWLVWECLCGKRQADFPGPSLLESRLGITRHTARKIVRDITALRGVFDEDGEFRSLGVELQTYTVCTDPVERVLNEVGVPSESRQLLRDEADRLKLTNTKFVKLIKKAVGRHDPGEYGDDPTPIIRSYLKKEATFKAKGRGTTLKKPAGV
jgi:hypothetical protein